MDVRTSGKTVGAYIYDTLLSHPNQKIKGGLIRTIERHFYKSELRQIITKQQEFIPQFRDKELLAACIEELYPNNIPHQQNLKQKGFVELFVDDIIFYQRPLKTQKHLISNCPYEYHTYRKGKEEKIKPLKCIPRSNPLFQEFRLWQFIHNLRIYKRQEWINGKLHTDVDVTGEFLPLEKKEALFEYLNNLGSIKQDGLLKNFWKIKKNPGEEHLPYRWNYVEDKSYPCNETRFLLAGKLKKCGIEVEFLTPEMENRLWHLLYSVEDPDELKKALSSFAALFHLPEQFVEEFVKVSSFKKEYGSYSGKAIKKLLTIMRVGKYWQQEEIDPHTYSRIDKLITGEADETINILIRERTSKFTSIDHFQGLPAYLACYIVYGRCSESSEVIKWNRPEEMQLYMESVFKQNCLRNPIVEQVVRETMRTVYDLWKLCGRIDEIHLELGREMKNPAAKRAAITSSITENENRNLRIKALLMELKSDAAIENVRPFSPGQQEILKIYEEGALMAAGDILKIFFVLPPRIAEPSRSELQRYKLWLEQKYCSPYTGRPIPLGKLFTPAYEIEHIIPQSRYFDDSLSNKVICESGVNKLKDNLLGYEFIKNMVDRS